jgi:D-alanine transfer protein
VRTESEAAADPARATRDRAATDGARLPVGITAALLAIVLAGVVGASAQYLARDLAARRAFEAAATPNAIKSKTLTLARAAADDDRLLPIYGSSELYCCGDPFRPTQLFASEPAGFEAFAIGRPGGSNLLFTEMFGALGRSLAGRKVVVVDSPNWFSARAARDAGAYGTNFSREIAERFVFTAPLSMSLKRAVARRMLAYPQTLEDDAVLRLAVGALAHPTPLHRAIYTALVPIGRVETWLDESWDAVATLAFFGRHDWRRTRTSPPATLDWDALAARATTIAEKRDTTNPFGFPDDVFEAMMTRKHKVRLDAALAMYRAGSSNRDGALIPPATDWMDRVAHSTQWTDLRLAVAVLHELGADPLVLSVPLPGFFDDHTPLSSPVRASYYDHWERTADHLGAPWLDFRAADEDRYFVTDPGGHLSPRGWIFADRALELFWQGRSLDEIRAALRDLADHVPAETAAAAPSGSSS